MIPEIRTILVVDDDDVFRERLALSLRRRQYRVLAAADAAASLRAIETEEPDAAIVDLRMPADNGLHLVSALRDRIPGIRIVMLTGYGSIATAVEAMRLGAVNYLTKPADAEQIEQALRTQNPQVPAAPSTDTPSLERVEWEHLQRVLAECDQNISKAARALGIERRTLQRKLQKYPPPK